MNERTINKKARRARKYAEWEEAGFFFNARKKAFLLRDVNLTGLRREVRRCVLQAEGVAK
jgi:hypothetical protein